MARVAVRVILWRNMRITGFGTALASLWLLAATAGAAQVGKEFDLQGFIDGEIAAGKQRVVVPPGCYRVSPKHGTHLSFKDLKDIVIVADRVLSAPLDVSVTQVVAAGAGSNEVKALLFTTPYTSTGNYDLSLSGTPGTVQEIGIFNNR